MNRVKYNYKRENLYTAIVFFPNPDGSAKMKAAKYRNIEADKPGSWARFVEFITGKFAGCKNVNLYGGISGDFIRQEKVG